VLYRGQYLIITTEVNEYTAVAGLYRSICSVGDLHFNIDRSSRCLTKSKLLENVGFTVDLYIISKLCQTKT